MAYATTDDYIGIYGVTLSSNDEERVGNLLDLASSILNVELHKRGKETTYITDDTDMVNVAKLIVCSSVHRVMKKAEEAGGDITQFSQSALGYSISGTYLNPGDDLYFLENELKRLGLKRQRIGVIEPYANQWYPSNSD